MSGFRCGFPLLSIAVHRSLEATTGAKVAIVREVAVSAWTRLPEIDRASVCPAGSFSENATYRQLTAWHGSPLSGKPYAVREDLWPDGQPHHQVSTSQMVSDCSKRGTER
jgi:hypothetical protein